MKSLTLLLEVDVDVEGNGLLDNSVSLSFSICDRVARNDTAFNCCCWDSIIDCSSSLVCLDNCELVTILVVVSSSLILYVTLYCGEWEKKDSKFEHKMCDHSS